MVESKKEIVKENPVIAALIKAKGNFGQVVKDCVNPFHKSKYAGLDSINKAVDAALLEQGLTIIQGLVVKEDGRVSLDAKLVHVSGYYDPEIQLSSYTMPPSTKPQDVGSAMTYGRRYNKSALLGIVADSDDDGNASTTISDPQYKRLIAIAKNKGWEDVEVGNMIKSHGFKNGKELTLSAYQEICTKLENKKDK